MPARRVGPSVAHRPFGLVVSLPACSVSCIRLASSARRSCGALRQSSEAFATIPLNISDFATRHPYGLGLWQNHIERILAGWVEDLAVPIYYV